MYNASLGTAGAIPMSERTVRPLRTVHHVKPGESLGSIARQYGTSENRLIQLNNHQLGSNGSALQPGMRLEILCGTSSNLKATGYSPRGLRLF